MSPRPLKSRFQAAAYSTFLLIFVLSCSSPEKPGIVRTNVRREPSTAISKISPGHNARYPGLLSQRSTAIILTPEVARAKFDEEFARDGNVTDDEMDLYKRLSGIGESYYIIELILVSDFPSEERKITTPIHLPWACALWITDRRLQRKWLIIAKGLRERGECRMMESRNRLDAARRPEADRRLERRNSSNTVSVP